MPIPLCILESLLRNNFQFYKKTFLYEWIPPNILDVKMQLGLDEIEGAKIERITDQPMWCEVIHGKNMLNDAYFLGAKMIRDENRLRCEFAIEESVKYGIKLYVFRFLPRYLRTFVKRSKRYIKRKW